MAQKTLPLAVALIAALALAGCDRGGDADTHADLPTAPAGDAMDDPSAPPPMADPAAGTPAEGTGQPAPGTITWEGFGPAEFGADQEAVRMAWGRDLGDARPSEPGGCYYLMPQPAGTDGVGFMIEQDRFVRIDVRDPQVEAPGGGRVGMPTAEIERLYPGMIETSPHKYEEGAHTLRIPAPEGRPGALVFETAPDGDVQQWRVGLPPQVDYVERCG